MLQTWASAETYYPRASEEEFGGQGQRVEVSTDQSLGCVCVPKANLSAFRTQA